MTGCAVALPPKNTSLKVSPPADSGSAENFGAVTAYQYAAPWDKEMFDGFYTLTKAVPDIGPVKGGIVPHHLVSGYMPATFFNYLSKQKPSLVVLIGPNHQNAGQMPVLTSLRDWQTPYGVLPTDQKLAENLLTTGLAGIDEGVMKSEHSIASLVSFIKKSLPETKILPIILKYKTPTSTLNELLENLKKNLPPDAVIVGSVDFSHYMTLPVANFHDELTIQAIKNFDYQRIDKLEIDSAPSLYCVLKLMDFYGDKKVGFDLHDNSATQLRQLDLAETTSHYLPMFIPGDKEPAKISSLLFFGDMMLERNVKNSFDKNGGPDYLFSALAGGENRFFEGMDAVHANLEGPFADYRRQTSKEIAFRFDPLLIPTLKKYNFSIFTAANNHSQDMGAAGFSESNKHLKDAGISVYGRQYSVDNSSLLIKQVGDYKIGFIGVNDTNSPVPTDEITVLIKKAKDQGAEKIIINLHWGTEYQESSNARQRTLAHALIDAGADAIIGHHPHVVQEMEVYRNRPIFYSLGNFIFDQYFSSSTQIGLSVGLVFKDKETSIYVFPLVGNQSQVSQMPFAAKENYWLGWQTKSRLDNHKFNDYNLKINL